MPEPVHLVRIPHLRDCLGVAYQSVAQTGKPVVIQRYSRADGVMVPKWESDWLKQIEDRVQAGLPAVEGEEE